MISTTPEGLFCAEGGFHLDPVRPVPLAVVTSPRRAIEGCGRVLDAGSLAFGERVVLGGVTLSLHPSGHAPGGAQARLEREGQVTVVARDWKREPDPTCPAFEVLRADVFVTGADWALPIVRWPEPRAVVAEIVAWAERNRAAGRASLLLVENAPRLLAELGASALERGLVLASPSEEKTAAKRLGPHETALVSPLMTVRGTRRRRALDRGFVLADQADWPSTLATIEETGARRVLTVGEHAETLARYLRERGKDAAALALPA